MQIRGFPGDEEKQAVLQRLLSDPIPADTSFANVTSVMGELDGLPLKAQQLVFDHWIAAIEPNSTSEWFESLFLWCFRNESDGDAEVNSSADADSTLNDNEEFVKLFSHSQSDTVSAE